MKPSGRRRRMPAGAYAAAAPGAQPGESDPFGRERPPRLPLSSGKVAVDGAEAGRDGTGRGAFEAGGVRGAGVSLETHEAGIAGVALEAREVGVCLEGRRILDDVSLTARRGEVHALVGPNGAGKSTLLSVLSGDQPADAGDVHVEGRPLHSWTLRELARQRGVLLQQNGVFFPFTVQQVVEMGRAPWLGTPRDAEDDVAVAEALDLTETSAFADRHVPSLSGGERARVAFARVLAQRTGILLLDEPTAALDLRHQEQVLTVARDRARAGDAVVVVLHDLTLAAAYSDAVTVLHGGHVAAAGAPREVFTAALLSEVYEHEIEVLEHPRTGASIVQPVRTTSLTKEDE